MKHPSKPLCLLILALGSLASLAREYEGARTNSILLNGLWEFACGDGTEGVEAVAGQKEKKGVSH
jgi:hypothetical protein